MSSHREAPAISKDPVADSTDTYAFVSPEKDGTVTLISNYVPLEAPFGGPNFFEFGDDVRYYIYVDNDGDGKPDVTYEFDFKTQVINPDTFLYNTGQILSLTDSHWNRRQTYSVTRVKSGQRQVLGTSLPCPPCNIGPLSTPNYADLAAAAVNPLPGGRTVFAGQRLEGFYVDLGSIFELGTLRPFQAAHIGSSVLNLPTGNGGVNATNDFGVHSIALKVPISDLTRDGSTPTNPASPNSVIGVWAAAARRMATILAPAPALEVETGPWVQVSRLGNPLINEVIIGMGHKDFWNSVTPADDAQFIGRYEHPELATLLPMLYPSPTFDHLAALNKSGAARADLVAILLTGIPSGLITGFQNFTGSTPADMLRLNMAIPPVSMSSANPLGVVAGDLAGFPNGRRVYDDVVTVELRAIAGLKYNLIDHTFTPDAAAKAITDGLTDADTTYLGDKFPYLGTPQGGYDIAPLATLS
jgi:hypothetical protein